MSACEKPWVDPGYEFNLIGENYTTFWSPFYYTDPDGSLTEIFKDGSIGPSSIPSLRFAIGIWKS